MSLKKPVREGYIVFPKLKYERDRRLLDEP